MDIIKTKPKTLILEEVEEKEKEIEKKEGTKGKDMKTTGLISAAISRISLYVLIFLLPLFFIPGIGLIQAKQFLAIILIGICLIAWLIKTIKSGKIVYAKSFLNIAVLFLVLILAVSSYFSLAREKSLGIFGLEIDTLINFSLFALAFFLAGANFKQEKHVKRVFWLILISMAILVVFQVIAVLRIPFVFNPFGPVRVLGIFLAIGLVMASFLLCRFRDLKAWQKPFLIIFALLVMGEIVFINLRAIWFGLAISMFFLACFQQFRSARADRTKRRLLAPSGASGARALGLARPRLHRGHHARSASNAFLSGQPSPLISLPIIILMVSIFLILIRVPLPNLLNLPDEISPTHSASLEIAKQVLFEQKAKTLLLGSGPGTFALGYGKFRSVIVNQTPFWGIRFSQASSFILTVLATTGILGIFAFGVLIGSFLYISFRTLIESSSAYRLGLIFATLFLICLWFFYPLNFVLGLMAFIGLGLVRGKSKEISLLVSPQRIFISSLGLILVIVLATASLYLSVQKLVALAYFSEASRSQDLDKAVSKVLKAISLNGNEDLFWRGATQLFLLKAQESLNQENQTEVLQQNISNAIFSARQATRINPQDSLNWTLLAQVYENILPFASGGEEFMRASYEQAISLEPKNPGLFLALARANLLILNRKGLSQEQKEQAGKLALENLAKAINLKPDYKEARMLLERLIGPRY